MGRQATWGHTSPPRASALSSSRNAPGVAFSAVQVTGRPVLMDSSASSAGPKSGPCVIANVPRSRSASGSASRISSPVVASLLGTGLPQAPAWAGWRDDAKPIAPTSRASPTSRRISSISAPVASRSAASSPSTYSRSGVWPSMTATFSFGWVCSTASRYSGKVSNVHGMPANSASTDIPSTFSSVLAMVSRPAGRVGAIPKPQLPMTTVVTPCQDEGVRSGSHSTCAS
jgi:hypothetical protein